MESRYIIQYPVPDKIIVCMESWLINQKIQIFF
jgi:hypothetical protein